MSGIRIAWLALAIAVGVLGSASAQWPVYEITSCEIGFDSLSSAVCLGTVHEYFGRQLFLVLAIPVALCIVPAVIPACGVLDRCRCDALHCCVGLRRRVQLHKPVSDSDGGECSGGLPCVGSRRDPSADCREGQGCRGDYAPSPTLVQMSR
jgi:hypothetical protein